uniref:Defensin-like protein n=1 Tax=Kalanchoe fedtschenkoi TaxID=63787 RepID=A0A7N0V3Z1_KALFE
MSYARKMCTLGIGVCGDNCNSLCKQQNPESEGYCNTDTQIPLCFCVYPCGPPDPPPTCRGGTGACDACGDPCCNERCARSYPGGTGACELVYSGVSGCYCYYPC